MGGDCVTFASQCIWYGLGGVDDYSSIYNLDWPMINVNTNTSRNWYQKGTVCTSDGAHAWIASDALKANVVSGGYHIDGLNGYSYSGVASASVGDIIQVDGNGDNVYDHSYVVVSVTGVIGSRTISDITVCCHTPDRSNTLLNTALYYDFGNSWSSLRTVHITNSWRYPSV